MSDDPPLLLVVYAKCILPDEWSYFLTYKSDKFEIDMNETFVKMTNESFITIVSCLDDVRHLVNINLSEENVRKQQLFTLFLF